MSKKKKSIIRLSYKPVFITLIVSLPVVFGIVVLMLSLMDYIFLKNTFDLGRTLGTNLRNAAIISLCLWGLIFYYLVSSFTFGKPEQSDVLASGAWKTIEEQKEVFATAPIDTSKSIEVGGAPVNKINEHQILYEKDAVHDLTLGSTRSGKSRKIVRQLVMLASMANESMIFNDPKKEMYFDFKDYLESKGYDVYCLDFRRPEFSNALNPLDDIVYQMELENIDEADQYAEDRVVSLVVDNGKSEPIWIEGQKALIKALILEVCAAPIARKQKNYYSVVQTLSVLGKEEKIDGKSEMLLSAYMDSLDEMSPARISYTPIANSPDKTRGSFMTSALATLHPFTGMKLMKVLGSSDFNFHDFTEGKKALFVVNPDEKHTYDAIASMVFDNAYQSLVFEANKLSGKSLKKRVHMIYDEFGNMPKINAFDSKMTVSLSRKILYHLYVQDFKQMNKIYGDDIASIIRGNCNLWYFISSGDYDACEEMSRKVGNKDIWVQSQSGNFNHQATSTGGGVNYSHQTRRLIDANELSESNFKDGHGIIVYRTYLGPCRVELPDCSSYSWYEQMKTNEHEVKNEKLSLDYAIPRYVVISDYAANVGISKESKEMEIRRAMMKPSLKKENMYWYWSRRNDIGDEVTAHLVQFLEDNAEGVEPQSRRRLLLDYMKTDMFIDFVHEIDKTDHSTEEGTKKVDKALGGYKDENELEEMFD